MIRNYIEEGPDLGPGKNPLMEAAKERDLDTDKAQEVQKAGKVALLEKNPEEDLVPLLIHLFKTFLGEGVGHPEEKRVD